MFGSSVSDQEMAKIHLSNVVVLDNPSAFLHPFQFEVTFECNEELKEGNPDFQINENYMHLAHPDKNK